MVPVNVGKRGSCVKELQLCRYPLSNQPKVIANTKVG